jgi:radical SAM superfamily enzyme with C-terminal helix-hairpin-helix motif
MSTLLINKWIYVIGLTEAFVELQQGGFKEVLICEIHVCRGCTLYCSSSSSSIALERGSRASSVAKLLTCIRGRRRRAGTRRR